MSDLEQLRDHARHMANLTVPEYHVEQVWLEDRQRYGDREHVTLPPTDAERAMWEQIADELDAHLTPADPGPDLFGTG